MLRILPLLVLVACADTSVTFDGPDPIAPEYGGPRHGGAALAIARGFFAAQTGADPGVAIHWTAERIAIDGELLEGAAFGCDLWVHVDPGAAFIPLAMSHELGHCFRGVVESDGDPAHADPLWWGSGGLVDRAHLAVRSAGL